MIIESRSETCMHVLINNVIYIYIHCIQDYAVFEMFARHGLIYIHKNGFPRNMIIGCSTSTETEG